MYVHLPSSPVLLAAYITFLSSSPAQAVESGHRYTRPTQVPDYCRAAGGPQEQEGQSCMPIDYVVTCCDRGVILVELYTMAAGKVYPPL